MSCVDLLELPDECLATILWLTSPIDVIRSSVVSKDLFTAAVSDAVWAKLLPSDYEEIISQSSTPLPHFASKKDLFFHLCNSPILLIPNTQSFSLDKRSGKKCYMLGARNLLISWGNTPQYWTWIAMPESRFPENANLEDVCWLDIKGRINTILLSSKTNYGAYFVYKMDHERNGGFDDTPVKVSIYEVDEEGMPRNEHQAMVVKRYYLMEPRVRRLVQRRPREEVELPTERGDGWMEIELGTYRVGVVDDHQGVFLQMEVREVEQLNWKWGLLVQGIELRPLD